MTILVTGGAGYIGAHVVRLLEERGEKVVVVDDLSYGDPKRIGSAKLLQLNLASDEAPELLEQVMRDEDVTAVIHFAARKQVGESMEKPAWYYQQNIGGMANLLLGMRAAGVKQMIFSSSAAVYGMPPVDVVSEDIVKNPINPYGCTKLIGEQMLASCEQAWGLSWVGLRYFNVAGAGWADLMDPVALNLVPMVLEKLQDGQEPLIFGEDYPTPDGTCIRDYIHVMDLAKAHLAALDRLDEGGLEHHAFNIGTGKGTSVKEIIDGLREVSGWDFPVAVRPRRAGDPPMLIGDASRVTQEMGWEAQYTVHDILQSAWDAWQLSDHPIQIPS